MRKLLAILCLAAACSPALAAKGFTVKAVHVDEKGIVHVVIDDGNERTIRPEKWQAGGGFRQSKVAPDGRTVGWLATQMLTPLQAGASYSYAVALELDIWRDGRVIRRFGPGQEITDWIFLQGGSEVALRQAPLHGDRDFFCALFDVNTGKELAHWALDRRDYVVPDWAKPLLVDALPSPEEISDWFPDALTPTKSAPQPKQ
jgi:hypothetical protein